MAKWKKEVVADIFYDGLTKACDEHLISKHHKRKLIKEIAVFFDIHALKLPVKHKDAIRKKIMDNTNHEAGPAQAKPAWGGKPGEDVVPQYEVLGSKFLKRRKA